MTVINGTGAAETLTGTSGDDSISGNGGTDLIHAGRGNDSVVGGDDRDLLYGESGDDTIDGGGGNDDLYGGAGDDIVHGGAGADYLESTENTGSDTLYGDDGDDYLFITRYQGSGSIAAYGGAGHDHFFIDVGAGATAAIDGGDGDDYVEVSSWDNAATVTLGAGRDLLLLSDLYTYSGISIVGVTVTDFQTGADGDVVDLFDALRTSATTWDGVANPFTAGLLTLTQSGADAILSYKGSRAIIFKNVSVGSFTAENFAGVSPTGTVSAARTMVGTDEGNIIAGGSGDDAIDGGAGPDHIFGGYGADSLAGGDGNDTIRGGAGNDVIDGGAGGDTLNGGFGDDLLHGGAGNDSLVDKDSGVDALYGDEGNDVLTVQRDSQHTGGSSSLFGGEGDDRFTINTRNSDAVFADGGTGNDTFNVNALVGTLAVTLGDGADLIDMSGWIRSATSTASVVVADFAPGAGDRLEWTTFARNNATGLSAGADPFAAGYARLLQSGGDVLLQYDRDGGANSFVTIVTFQNRAVADFTSASLGGFNPAGTAVAGVALSGTEVADRLIGDGGADSIDGLGGDDILYGLLGADTLSGGGGRDIIWGGFGNDVIDGGDDNDSLYGQSGDDIVHGGLGNDFLSETYDGNDALYGGEGDDTLYAYRGSGGGAVLLDGGTGNDLLQIQAYDGVFTVLAGDGNDEVDFFALNALVTLTLGAGQDTIVFDNGFFFPSFASSPTVASQGPLTITDFQAGDGGDRIDFDGWLASDFGLYDASVSPFAAGILTLAQSGSDAVLLVFKNPGSSPVPWITFKNTSVWSLTAYNFDGYETNFTVTHGTAADETFTGGSGNDGFDGGAGNDTVLIGFGGGDYAAGGDGDDTVFVALTSLATRHEVLGGAGTDVLQLQGHGTQNVTIGASAESGTVIDATGIEKLQLLASGDPSRSWNAGLAAAYIVTLEDSVAAAGTTFEVDASGLAAVDSLTFSTDEADASLHVTGGAGNDVLDGGALGDVIAGGAGNDRLDGQSGNDQLDGGDGNDILSYLASAGPDRDVVAGGAGSDILDVSFELLAGTAPLAWSMTPDGAGGYSGYFATDADHRVDFTGIERFAVTGGAGADDVSGGGGDDLLIGGGGDDVIHGNGGRDLITGDSGTDTLIGGAGDDTYIVEGAGDAADVVVEVEGEGQDTIDTDFAAFALPDNVEYLIGTAETGQTLTGNGLDNGVAGFTGNDFLYGLGGNDVLLGDAGNDLLDGGAGADAMTGGTGNDIYYVDDSGDIVTEASSGGTDEVRTALAAYALGANVENLTGLSGAGQTLTGNGLSNQIAGGAGNDVFRLEAGGSDLATGNGGDDSFVFGLGFSSGDRANGGSGNDVVYLQGAYAGTFNALAFTSIETIVLMSASDTRFGASGTGSYSYRLNSVDANVAAGETLTIDARGLGAAETLTFTAAAETNGRYVLLGGAGADSLTGGAGADTLDGGAGADLLVGGAGADALRGGSGDDTYEVDDIGDTVTELGGEGTDTVRTALGNQSAIYALAANVEKLIGTSAAGQMVAGNALDNVMTMGGGNDVLDLRSGGNDTVFGNAGNDYIFFGDSFTAADTIVGGAGTDTVALLGNYNLTLGANTLSGVETFNLLSGTAAGGTEHVSYSITTVDANIAAGGRLTVYAGTLLADESLFFNGYAETDGAVSVYGGAGNDTFAGGPANDAFVGGAGDDQMYGLGGMDWLEGGLGADQMRGGPGNDLFVYMSAAESTAAKTDHIFDFEDTQDHISLTAIDANSNVAGDQAFNFIGGNAFSHTAGELRAYQSGSDWFVEGDVDGDGNADLVIQVTTFGGHVMAASDFLL